LAPVITGPWEGNPPSARRRPPRDDVVTYRLRIDLDRTRPPLWRRLEVASDLFLDDLHWIIQVAFGWDNGHLHEFSSGRGWEAEHYLCPEVDDGGIPEEEVRLDEVLVDRGDKLRYEYDFGDGWEHTIKLEAVLPHTDSEPVARCVAGRRDGPAGDCGGVYAYEEMCAAGDPDHELIRFDIGAINETLTSLTREPDGGES
jgi:hypothetical protein